MIREALTYIVTQLNTFITPISGTADDTVVLGNIALADPNVESSAQSVSNRIVVSVVNVEQEKTLRNLPYKAAGLDANGNPTARAQEPPVYLNIYVLFGANNNNYENALHYLARVIAFFQRRSVFSPETDAGLNAGIEKLLFELHSMSFDQLNHLWGILGGKYIPSVVYKMRLVMIQDADEDESSVVRAIRFDEFSN
ncbi:MAG: DUF4255 domain-containing protein [Bacteroidia bacterium]|nr:DUF4255 domain-containing protein [Bacteroidia bacterium]